MIGVAIPVHNEEETLRDCLNAVLVAAAHEGLQREAVMVMAVLDNCSDASERIAQSMGINTLAISARNVGRARAAGADFLVQQGCRWLAFTDADTIVAPDWLTMQTQLGADAVCGTVAVSDWSPHGFHGEQVRRHFAEHYNDIDGHRHIHGANLGVSAAAYCRAGGFPPLALSEDVALVEALTDTGANIAWSALPRVCTSARINARAVGGFGDTLRAYVSDAPSIAQVLLSRA